jgi:type IV secretory pathway VirJ component
MLGMLLSTALLGTGTPVTDTTLIPDLPLVEARAPGPSRTLAILWSGDGNWASFVHDLTRELNARGIPVVGLKSRAYLTGPPPKNPERAGRDLALLLRAYLTAWGADSALLIGYSRGADLLPFAVSRLDPELRQRIEVLALISPSVNASFEFHWRDLVSNQRRASDLATLPEVRKLRDLSMLCIYGTEDGSALCPTAEPGLLQTVARASGHHMDDPAGIADLLLAALARR